MPVNPRLLVGLGIWHIILTWYYSWMLKFTLFSNEDSIWQTDGHKLDLVWIRTPTRLDRAGASEHVVSVPCHPAILHSGWSIILFCTTFALHAWYENLLHMTSDCKTFLVIQPSCTLGKISHYFALLYEIWMISNWTFFAHCMSMWTSFLSSSHLAPCE